MNQNLTRVYAAIAGVPIAAIALAAILGGAGGGGSSATSGVFDWEGYEAARGSNSAETRPLSEAELYRGLGPYNPCIFIACEGEEE